MNGFRDFVRQHSRDLGLEGRVVLCGHKVWSSDALVLQEQYKREGFDFSAWLSDMGVYAWIDTLVLAQHHVTALRDSRILNCGAIYHHYTGKQIVY